METNVEEIRENVVKLVEKAVKSEKSDDAMRYAQSALNAANTYCSLKSGTK